jgi:citrate lyase beta subunit
MLVISFVPIRSALVMARLLRSFHGANSLPILDLEDGHWDLQDENRTPARKAAARERLLELCALPPARLQAAPVAMRLNSFSSPDFELDLPVAEAVAKRLGLRMILLPKVAAAGELRAARAALERFGVPCGDLVPMVESQAGLNLLGPIIGEAVATGASGVVYGYYDHSLETGEWPFMTMNQARFWEIVGEFARPVRAAGLRYIHPPPTTLHDREYLRLIVMHLRRLTGEHCGIFSAGLSQTPILQGLRAELLVPGELEAWAKPAVLTQAERRQTAEQVRNLFEANQREQLSFATDGRSGRFIPPHEYLAALRYLREGGCA